MESNRRGPIPAAMHPELLLRPKFHPVHLASTGTKYSMGVRICKNKNNGKKKNKTKTKTI
jgi:hypothetical protein